MEGFKIFNLLRQDITPETKLTKIGDSMYSANLNNVSSGIYLITTNTSKIKVIKQ